MKRLLREAWKEPEFWIFAVFFGLLTLGCLTIVGSIQRAEFYRRFDESNRKMIAEMHAEIERLRVQNERSIADRKAIHEDVNKVKKSVIEAKKDEE